MVIDPSPDLDLMREEIFGPLLPVIPYDDVKDAMAFINAQPRPLAMYWFDNDGKRAESALKNTHAGGVCFNETLMHVAQEDLAVWRRRPIRHGPLSWPLGFRYVQQADPRVSPVATQRHEALSAAVQAACREDACG